MQIIPKYYLLKNSKWRPLWPPKLLIRLILTHLNDFYQIFYGDLEQSFRITEFDKKQAIMQK